MQLSHISNLNFKALLENNIQSAPVFDSAKKEYIGFLDVHDLVSFVCFVYDEQKVSDNNTLKDTILHGVKMFKTPATDGVTLSYLARRNKFTPVHQNTSLLSVVELLTHGLHRVPVLSEEGKVINIISQYSIIAFLEKHLDDIKDLISIKFEDAKIGTNSIYSVRKNTSVIETLRLMDSKKLSGIAIVDSQERLVGTTTGKDLVLFLKNPSLSILQQPIFNFLNEVRNLSIDILTPTISIFKKDKVARIISILSSTHVHRIFIVDGEENYKPISVVSLSDVLKFLSKL